MYNDTMNLSTLKTSFFLGDRARGKELVAAFEFFLMPRGLDCSNSEIHKLSTSSRLDCVKSEPNSRRASMGVMMKFRKSQGFSTKLLADRKIAIFKFALCGSSAAS